ncbi:MAG: ATP-binding cassette domain-containing protein [Acidimicrobiia bacterium]
MNMLIEAKDVTVRYGKDTVLDIRRLQLRGPGLVVVTGPNGAGKSTLLRLCAGLQRPKDGVVEVNGVKAHRRRARLNSVYSPDHPVLFDDLTIADNITYAHEATGSDEPTKISRDLLAAFGLERLLKRYPAQLSRGQRQAASLVVAAARPVDIMLFDEPTLSLDQENRTHLSDVLASHKRDHLLMVATHDEGLTKAAKRRLRLADGRLA